MSQPILNKEKVFDALPPEWEEDLLPRIRTHLEKSATKIVVLDDDPTGTQTVHGIPVLTSWGIKELETELKTGGNAFFILTNSRGLGASYARELARELGSNLAAASRSTGIPVSVISRSDSTLRGHFPDEVDACASAMGTPGSPYLICPFFLEGGRFTIDNIHYVADSDRLVPAAQTPYAKDAAFGFTRSELPGWVEEKTDGRIPAASVTCIGLEDIRIGGPEKVCRILTRVEPGTACIVNAVSYRDMEVLVQGLLLARGKGSHFLYRTAASFVRVRTGIAPKGSYLKKDELLTGSRNGGLFVVGSYVPKTTAQVERLLSRPNIMPVEVDVNLLLDPLQRLSTIRTAALDINQAIKSGRDTVLFTSRELVRSDDPGKSLKIGQVISRSLIRIIHMLDCQPGYLVAKGGITSSDVATIGLGVKRARVLGQVLPGVPVWQLGEESVYPGMSYIIFPGNVGEDDALSKIQTRLHLEKDGSHA